MIRKIASGINGIFSPLLIPTYTTLLLIFSDLHFSMFSWPAKRFLVIIVFMATALMPGLTLLIAEFGKGLRLPAVKPSDTRIAFIFTALYYYMGFYLLSKMAIYSVFKVMLLTGAILIVTLLILSIWTEISSHMAALGGVFGLLLALYYRTGTYQVHTLVAVILTAGFVGSFLMVRQEKKLGPVLTGYITGFTVFFLIFYLL